MRENIADVSPLTDEESLKLFHELQVHQIELEMQNEELRQTRDDLDAMLEKFTDLYDFAPVGYLNLDRAGTIRTVNLTGADLLGVERSLLVNRRLGHFLPDETRSFFNDFLDKVFASETKRDVRGCNPERKAFPALCTDRGSGLRIKGGVPCCDH